MIYILKRNKNALCKILAKMGLGLCWLECALASRAWTTGWWGAEAAEAADTAEGGSWLEDGTPNSPSKCSLSFESSVLLEWNMYFLSFNSKFMNTLMQHIFKIIWSCSIWLSVFILLFNKQKKPFKFVPVARIESVAQRLHADAPAARHCPPAFGKFCRADWWDEPVEMGLAGGFPWLLETTGETAECVYEFYCNLHLLILSISIYLKFILFSSKSII